MNIWIVILVSILYIILYTFSSFLFNYKIYLVSNDKYYLGSIISGVAFFISFSLYAFIPFLSIAFESLLLLVFLIISLSVGSFISTIVLNKIDFLHNKKNNKINNENKEEE